MVKPFPFEAYTRVSLVTSIEDMLLPTVDELDDSTRIDCDIARGGLNIQRNNQSTNRTPWCGDVDGEVPTRYGVSITLTAYRFTVADLCDIPMNCDCAGALWQAAATYRAPGFLAVRRGVLADTDWAVDDVVEVYKFAWGKRSVIPVSDADFVTFSVPLYVVADVDDATIVASPVS